MLEFLCILLGILCLSPFYLVVVNSAKKNAEIISRPLEFAKDWGNLIENVTKVMTNATFRYRESFLSSVIITVCSLLLLTITASMAAWVLVRSKKTWSNWIFMLFVAAMVIPFQVVMLPLVTNFRRISELIGIPMLGSYQGIIFAYLGFGGSMSVFVLHGFLKGIPFELEEAALIDGCRPEQTFVRVIFPLLRPVQMTVIILNGIWIWNDFLLPSLTLGMNGRIKTLPIAVTSFVGSYVKQWDLILTAALLAMLPIVILFLFAQKYIIKGMIEGAIK